MQRRRGGGVREKNPEEKRAENVEKQKSEHLFDMSKIPCFHIKWRLFGKK